MQAQSADNHPDATLIRATEYTTSLMAESLTTIDLDKSSLTGDMSTWKLV